MTTNTNPSPNTLPFPPHATRTETDAAVELATTLAAPHTLMLHRGTAEEASVLLAPKGFTVHPVKPLLDPYRARPERRAGETVLHDLESFVEFVTRAQNDHSVVYVDATIAEPRFCAVLDHDERGPDGTETARWAAHRAAYTMRTSEAWRAWTRPNNSSMSQTEFAEFIEARALDLLDPDHVAEHQVVALARQLALKLSTPTEVILASRGLRLRAEVNVGEAITLASGEVEFHFSETHSNAGGGALVVPSAFLIAIPVSDGGPRDVLLARLRYRRAQNNRVTWSVTLHQPEEVMRVAVDDAVKAVAARTGLPVLKGVAPVPRI